MIQRLRLGTCVVHCATNSLALAVMLAACASAAAQMPSDQQPVPGTQYPVPGTPNAPPIPAGLIPGGLVPGEEMVVDVRVEGAVSIAVEKITEKIRTHAGRPYDAQQISKDVRALYLMNRFVSVTPLKQAVPGGCLVIFRIVERPVFRQVIFAGNDNIRSNTLRTESGLKAGDAADPFAVQNAATKIREYYEREGYARVRVTILEGDKVGDLRAIFIIDEGQRQKIYWVSFVGNSIVSSAHLRTIVSSKHPYFYLFSGEVDHKTIEEDVNKLTAYYRGLGFFKAKVGRELEFNESQTWCTLTFVIDEGPRYAVRNISVVGNQRLPADRLTENFKLQNGDYFDQTKQAIDLNSIRDEYGGHGYVFAKIDPEIQYLDEPGKVDIVYNIDEGAIYHVGKITIAIKGDNPHTQLTTILNRLSAKPGDIADTRKFRDDERRLKASGLYLNDPQKNIAPKLAYSAPESEDKDTAIAEGPKTRTSFFTPYGNGPLPPLPQGEKYLDVVVHEDGESAAAFPEPVVAPPRFVGSTGGASSPNAPSSVVPTQIVPERVSPDLPCAPSPDEAVYPMEQPLVVRGQYGADPNAVWNSAPQQQPQPMQQVQPQQWQQAQQPAYANQPAAYANGGTPQFAPAGGYDPRVNFSAGSNAPQQGYAQPQGNIQPQYAAQPMQYNALANPYGAQPGTTAPANYNPPPAPSYQPQPAASGYGPPAYPSAPPVASGQVYSAAGTSPSDAPATGNAVFADGSSDPGRPKPILQTTSEDIYSDPTPKFYPTPTGDPQRDLPVAVGAEEAQTGRLMFGVGVNSDAGLVGNVTLDEQNFDIMRPPASWDDVVDGRAWRGAGQRFRVELAPGTAVQRYMVSFQEPYLFDTPVSYGLSGFYYERIYTEWTETRAGGRVSLGYQFTPDLQGSVSFQAQHVDIKNPEYPNAAYPFPVPSLESALGYSELYTFGGELRYDKRDSPFLATQGYQIQGSLEETIGTYQYPRVTLNASKYFTMAERADGTGRQVLSLSAKAGYSGDDTPIFERYYGGGFSSIRGFAFRGVTPRDPGSQMGVGGDFQLFTTAQYLFPITADDMLRGVVFCDAGTVEPTINHWNEKMRVAPGFGLRITIPMMGPAPIALDFAFPLVKQPGDQNQVFSFFVGIGGS